MAGLSTREELARAAAALRAHGRHVAPVAWHDRAAWLKLAVAPPAGWRYGLLGVTARLLGVAAIQPVRPYGGARGLAVEAGRIRALRAAGLGAPEILAEADGWLLLSDLGSLTLETRICRAASDARLPLWQLGADYLVAAHRAGEYLSQAFLRNFVWSENGLGAIDFEDDVRAVLSLPDAQARDWLLYAFSSAYHFSDRLPELARALAHSLEREDAAVRSRVCRILRRTRWIRLARCLPQRRRDMIKSCCYGELARLACAMR